MPKMKLKALRINKELSRDQVAEFVGVSPGTVKNWELGVTFPKQPHIMLLCELYDVEYDYIDFSK